MARRDGDGRARHEAADGGGWDELHEPTDPKQAHTEGNEAANKREGSGDRMRLPSLSVGLDDMLDYFCDGEGHDGDWSNGHILGRGEELSGKVGEKAGSSETGEDTYTVDQDTNERRIQTILSCKASELGVGHALWDNDHSDGQPSNNVP